MHYLRADTQTIVTVGPVVAVGDGFTPIATLSLSTADEAELLKHNSNTVVDISGRTFAATTSGDGYYGLTLTTADTNTEGRLVVLINDDSLCLPVRVDFMVVNANVFDSLFAAATTDYLQVDTLQVTGVAEDLPTATALATAQTDLDTITGTDGVTLATAQANYAPNTVVPDAAGVAPTTGEIADAVWDETLAGHVTADTAGLLLNEWQDGGRLDLILDIVAADTTTDIPALIAALNDLSAAQVNAECDTAIADAALATAASLATVQSDTDDIQARLPAALVSGRMSSDTVSISGSTVAADNLEASSEVIVVGAAQTGTLSTTQMTSDLSEATDDHYIGRVIIWTSGVLTGQATNITDYTGASGLLTYSAVTEAPSNGNTFVII